MAPQLDTYFRKVDDLSESFIGRLRKAVAIPSVSAEDERRADVVRVSSSRSPSVHRGSTLTDDTHRCPNFLSMN